MPIGVAIEKVAVDEEAEKGALAMTSSYFAPGRQSRRIVKAWLAIAWLLPKKEKHTRSTSIAP